MVASDWSVLRSLRLDMCAVQARKALCHLKVLPQMRRSEDESSTFFWRSLCQKTKTKGEEEHDRNNLNNLGGLNSPICRDSPSASMATKTSQSCSVQREKRRMQNRQSYRPYHWKKSFTLRPQTSLKRLSLSIKLGHTRGGSGSSWSRHPWTRRRQHPSCSKKT